MREGVILNICKEIIQTHTGILWRNFRLDKIEECQGYISKRAYFNCYVSYDNHPHDDEIFTQQVAVSPTQIRDKIIEEIIK